MMTPEELKFIREWAASGNEPRNFADIPPDIDGLFDFDSGAFVVLNSAGLYIARLADALEQANETAESGQWCLMQDTTASPHKQLTTMRANRKEIIG